MPRGPITSACLDFAASACLGFTLACLVFVVACGGSNAVDDARARGDVPVCTIGVGTPQTFGIPPRLQAIAPQYFHAHARDSGFNDLVEKTKRYDWYDPSNLDVAVVPPKGMDIIWHATKSYLVGHGDDGLVIARRGDKTATTLDAKLHLHDVVEDGMGFAWILGSTDLNKESNLVLVRVDESLASRLTTVAVVKNEMTWDRRVGVSRDGKVTVVWPARTANGIALVTWFEEQSFEIDRVGLSDDAATAAMRSGVDLRVTPHEHGIAVGWRPLAPKPREIDLGSQSEPPSRGSTADVRIVSIDRGQPYWRMRHPVFAQPVEFTSGIGPWPLLGNGLHATTVKDHAVFFWLDEDRAVWATPTMVKPLSIAKGNFRLLPRRTPSGAHDVLLLRSNGTQQAAALNCR